MLKRLGHCAVLLAIAAGLGCSGTGRNASVQWSASQHLIFNPEWTGIPSGPVAREVWPATAAFVGREEEVFYRETIIDWQGRTSGGREPVYYRRFNSIRTGRAHR